MEAAAAAAEAAVEPEMEVDFAADDGEDEIISEPTLLDLYPLTHTASRCRTNGSCVQIPGPARCGKQDRAQGRATTEPTGREESHQEEEEEEEGRRLPGRGPISKRKCVCPLHGCNRFTAVAVGSFEER